MTAIAALSLIKVKPLRAVPEYSSKTSAIETQTGKLNKSNMVDTYTAAPETTARVIPPIFRLGFRPFFLGALIFAELAVALWTLVYTFSLSLPMTPISPFQWHAHEMIYGYSLAVIAGFLLTAVRNWTGLQTIHGRPLLGLVVLWAAARLSMLAGTALLYPAAVFDLSFTALLIIAVAIPIGRAGKWKHFGIVSKLFLLGVGNAIFYMGCFGYLDLGVHWGIYGGLYVVIGLILVIGRRVIPFFIERGIDSPVSLVNFKWIDFSSLILFLALFVTDVFSSERHLVPYFAAALFAVNLVRLAGWYTPGIWRNPLLWSLYAAYAFIIAGFLLLALSGFAEVSRFVAFHAFAYGGIGVITLSMMTRVSVGHTGRDVNARHPPVFLGLSILVVGAVFRVVLPLLLPNHYVAWIAVSQLLWLVAFAVIAAFLVPILVRPRIDGRYG